MATKMTKKDRFNALLNMAEVQADPSMVEWIERELEMLAKKNSGAHKETANQKANAQIKETVVSAMERDTAYTIAELCDLPEVAEQKLSSQKMTALVSQLVKDGIVVRTMEKRKAYFSLA